MLIHAPIKDLRIGFFEHLMPKQRDQVKAIDVDAVASDVQPGIEFKPIVWFLALRFG